MRKVVFSAHTHVHVYLVCACRHVSSSAHVCWGVCVCVHRPENQPSLQGPGGPRPSRKGRRPSLSWRSCSEVRKPSLTC